MLLDTNERSLTLEKQEFFELLQKHKIFTPPMGPNLVCKYNWLFHYFLTITLHSCRSVGCLADLQRIYFTYFFPFLKF